MEFWRVIEEFPNYRVSNYGRVLNDDTGRILKESSTRTGLIKVGLVQSGVQHTRSVALLVAENFVDGKDDIFDTPVHLDGDKRNNMAENLVWRPRWFAWKFARQFSFENVHNSRGPIIDIESGVIYETFLDASKANGILVDDIWKCLIHKKKVFPSEQSFRFVK